MAGKMRDDTWAQAEILIGAIEASQYIAGSIARGDCQQRYEMECADNHLARALECAQMLIRLCEEPVAGEAVKKQS